MTNATYAVGSEGYWRIGDDEYFSVRPQDKAIVVAVRERGFQCMGDGLPSVPCTQEEYDIVDRYTRATALGRTTATGRPFVYGVPLRVGEPEYRWDNRTMSMVRK